MQYGCYLVVFITHVESKKNHDESPTVIQFLDYQEYNMYVKNNRNNLVPKRSFIIHAYATRAEAVAELLEMTFGVQHLLLPGGRKLLSTLVITSETVNTALH